MRNYKEGNQDFESNIGEIKNTSRYINFKLRVLMPTTAYKKGDAKSVLTDILNMHGVLSGKMVNFILTDVVNLK